MSVEGPPNPSLGHFQKGAALACTKLDVTGECNCWSIDALERLGSRRAAGFMEMDCRMIVGQIYGWGAPGIRTMLDFDIVSVRGILTDTSQAQIKEEYLRLFYSFKSELREDKSKVFTCPPSNAEGTDMCLWEQHTIPCAC